MNIKLTISSEYFSHQFYQQNFLNIDRISRFRSLLKQVKYLTLEQTASNSKIPHYTIALYLFSILIVLKRRSYTSLIISNQRYSRLNRENYFEKLANKITKQQT